MPAKIIRLDREQVRQLTVLLVQWLSERYKFVRFIRLTRNSVELDLAENIKDVDQLILELADEVP